MAHDDPVHDHLLKREVLDLFDAYVHGKINRRGFLDSCGAHVGSAALATGILAALTPDFARAQVIKPEDARITVEWADVPSPQGNGHIRTYVARPAGSAGKKLPVIVVVHENRGLNPHIEDIARRLAVDGFIAIAPDALTSLGGYPGDEDKARELFSKLDRAKMNEDFIAATTWALTMKGSNGKLGVTGFCFGGGMANMLATKFPQIRAAVPFYGTPPMLADVPKIKAFVMPQYGGNDTRVTGTWPEYEAALKAAGVAHEGFVYPGAEHGFNNDTTPRFNPEAAKLAWGRTMDLFRKTLL